MSSGKRLIVNADDFGRTPGINAGIVEAHRRGIVTSATLMVNFAASAEAADLARETPSLGVGLHLALTGGKPTLPVDQVLSLVDGHGLLPGKPDGLVGARPAEILAEARAQLQRFRKLLGRNPTHFDSHHHAHRLPDVCEALITLSWETGLPVRHAAPWMEQRFRQEGIPTPNAFMESFFDQGATAEDLLKILCQVGPGVTELMCHPARVDDELRASSSYAEVRDREREILSHPETRAAVQSLGIRLVHFGDLGTDQGRG